MGLAAERFQPIQDQRDTATARPISLFDRIRTSQAPPREVPDVLVTHALFERGWGPIPPDEPPSTAATPTRMTPPLGHDTLASMTDRRVATLARIRAAPPAWAPRERFLVLQKWEGTVTSVFGDGFTAVMRDLTDPGRPDEEMTLPIEEVADPDRPLMVPGAVFYWAIGYRIDLSGRRERVSGLRFRRLPVWTASDLREVRRKADELARDFL